MTKSLIVAAIAITGLAACGGNPTGRGETVGTVGGAAVGGMAGSAATGGSTMGTVGGAVLGGILGNEAGERYDERDRRR
jgi:osmotically inducible lipoprotein OsmB